MCAHVRYVCVYSALLFIGRILFVVIFFRPYNARWARDDLQQRLQRGSRKGGGGAAAAVNQRLKMAFFLSRKQRGSRFAVTMGAKRNEASRKKRGKK